VIALGIPGFTPHAQRCMVHIVRAGYTLRNCFSGRAASAFAIGVCTYRPILSQLSKTGKEARGFLPMARAMGRKPRDV